MSRAKKSLTSKRFHARMLALYNADRPGYAAMMVIVRRIAKNNEPVRQALRALRDLSRTAKGARS